MLPIPPNATRLSNRLRVLIGALEPVITIEEVAFFVRVISQLLDEGRSESECVVTLLSLSIKAHTDDIEALATPDELALATKLALAIVDPTKLTVLTDAQRYALNFSFRLHSNPVCALLKP